MISTPFIEHRYDDRIMALHRSSVYAMGLHVRREMSLFMRSMPQLSHIFRFISPLIQVDNCTRSPLFRRVYDSPRLMTYALLSNLPAMIC